MINSYKLSLRFLTTLLILPIFFSACFKNEDNQIPKDLNIILLSVDTLASRYISSYGSNTQTPTIDNLAKNGVRFSRTYSVAPWTKPAFTSIFSGVYPQTHSIKRLESKIPDNIPLLAEIMKTSKRQTAAVVSHTLLAPKAGFARGFDFYKNVNPENPHKAIVAEKVTNTAIDWLNKRDKKQSLFMFLHYFDPHYNYNHHPSVSKTDSYKGALKPGTDIRELHAKMFSFSSTDSQYLRDLYAEEVAYTDAQIARLLDYLKQEGLLDNSLIVFVADHGEEIMERNWIGHTRNLYNDLISVPFIIHLPQYIAPKVIDVPVSQVDILPTILDITKIKSKIPLNGISLLPALLNKAELPADRPVYSDVDFQSGRHVKDAFKTSVVRNDYKLIHNREDNSFELYDVVKDPEEKQNIAKDNPTIIKELTDLLLGYEKSEIVTPSQDLSITPKEVKQLQSLGYM